LGPGQCAEDENRDPTKRRKKKAPRDPLTGAATTFKGKGGKCREEEEIWA